MAFLLQLNPSIPCRSCVQSLEERKTAAPCSIPGAGQLRARGQRQHCGREGSGNAAQSAELWTQSLPAKHGYMYILRKFNHMLSISFLGLLINHLRVEETPGQVILLVPARCWSRKWCESLWMESALPKCPPPLCMQCPPWPSPVLLTSTQEPLASRAGWEPWECDPGLCRLSLGWNTSIPCLHL